MEDARGQTVSRAARRDLVATARMPSSPPSGTVITFRGFLARVRGGPRRRWRDGRRRAAACRSSQSGEALDATELEPKGHATSPPARYTEASLVKALEERGIGRPSTYASIMGTILDRGYVSRRARRSCPTFLAFAVMKLLEQHFARSSTTSSRRAGGRSRRIAGGEEKRVDWLSRFYRGTDADDTGLQALVTDHLDEIDAREVNSIPIPAATSSFASAATGRTSSGATSARACPRTWRPTSSRVEKAEELLAKAVRERELGVDPETGRQIVARDGPLRAVRERGARGGREREAADRVAVQDDGARHDHARGRAAAALAAADAGAPDGEEIDRGERPLRPVHQEGQGDPLARAEEQLFTVTLEEALASSRSRRSARPRRSEAAAEGARPRPRHGKPIASRKAGSARTSPTARRTRASGAATTPIESITIERAAELLPDRRRERGRRRR